MKKNNKGFTLVELIVVLVILAILAAILVPTLLGYIDRARSEKNFSTAQTVRVAAQATIDQAYGDGVKTEASGNNTAITTIEQMDGVMANTTTTYGANVKKLAGAGDKVTKFSFNYTDGIITDGTVEIDGHTYSLSNTGSWSAS